MPLRHREFGNLRVIDHPLIRHKLARMRDAQTAPPDFRRLLGEIAGLMVYEVSRDFPTTTIEIQTPMERTRGEQIHSPVTLVPILRAGIGMTNGILALMPGARVGHIGIYRDEATLEPVAYYDKFPPDIAEGPVLLIDPMLATGGSACHAAATLKDRGCRDIRFVCLVAAPPGVNRMMERHADVPIYAAALDRQLDERGYILPGLGDAGDRIFGTQ
jgi:uracil phosphoribosyltransferase